MTDEEYEHIDRLRAMGRQPKVWGLGPVFAEAIRWAAEQLSQQPSPASEPAGDCFAAEVDWVAVEDAVPDEGIVVMIYGPGYSEPVWLGYAEGGEWFTAEGRTIYPTHWRELPQGPVDGAAVKTRSECKY